MGLVAEAQRRRVFRVAAAYLVVGWLVVQVAATVLPQFELPAWAPRMVTLLVALGLPIALVTAWVVDITAEGVRLDASTAGTKRIAVAAIAVVVLALGWFFHGHVGNSPQATTVVAPSGAMPSIAVLPFVDMSQAHDQGYFSDGLAEELLNLLAQVPQLRVISRTSSFSFKDKEVDVATIARALNVANVLEGSVRKSGNTLRITAQLIRAADSSHLWSQTYDRQLTDVFKVQDDIAAAVVAAMKVKLLPQQTIAQRPRSANPDAYDQFLIGNQFNRLANADNWRRAIAAYERSIALDPGYAPAYAALASAQGGLGDVVGDQSLMEQSLRTADTAIRMAPQLPDGYVTRGIARMSFHHDWRGAKVDFDKALTLNPSDGSVHVALGRSLIALGDVRNAIAASRKGVNLDPLSPGGWVDLGRYLNSDHQYAAARDAINRALQISPDSNYGLYHLGETALLEGNAKEALGHFLKAGGGYRLAGVAMAQHTLGRDPESRQALDREIAASAQAAAYQIAEAFAWRGENDKAFAWLDRALVQHDGGLTFIKADPLLAGLRDDPRYAALIRKLGLPG